MNPRHRAPPAASSPDELDIDRLQALLDAVPAPLEPLDVSMLDGYLCGVLVQPKRGASRQGSSPSVIFQLPYCSSYFALVVRTATGA